MFNVQPKSLCTLNNLKLFFIRNKRSIKKPICLFISMPISKVQIQLEPFCLTNEESKSTKLFVKMTSSSSKTIHTTLFKYFESFDSLLSK